MYICSGGHEEIIHDGLTCPMCSLMDQHDDKVRSLETEIKSLTDEMTELKQKGE